MAAPRLLIVVPARGGSKGLPRKNIRPLAGKPLLSWTVEAIHAANLDGSLAVLSTDDEEIARAGRAAGLEVPFLRPAEYATDEATAESVALHALDWATREHGSSPERVMLLQPTSPFRPPRTLVDADAMLDAHADAYAVLGVKSIHRSLATLFRMDDKGGLRPLAEKEPLLTRRQNVEPLYTPNGAMYLVRTAVLRERSGFFPPRCRALVMDAVASLDIDSEEDWQIAEGIANARKRF